MSIFDFIENSSIMFKDNVYFFSDEVEDVFERHYIKLRTIENRLYSDKIVKDLPNYTGDLNTLKNEWELRKNSVHNLKKYLTSNFSSGIILEIGCGNGWLTNYLNTSENILLGLDINKKELRQATRLFSKGKIFFLCSDFNALPIPENSCDIVVLSSSIQYFSDLKGLINKLKNILKLNGEIHILDTYFYKENEIKDAKKRSEVYFASRGVKFMIENYFHHSWTDLNQFKPIILNSPSSFKSKFKSKVLKTNLSQFPWILIKK